jgi:hypothetical protein
LELLATLPGPDRLVYLQGLAVARELTEIGYMVKHVELPGRREAIVDLTNPKLEHALIQKGLYKEVAYLESTGSIHITPFRIEGEIPHAPPVDERFRQLLFAAGCSHTAHVNSNAVHEHFICAHNKLNLILKLAEDAFTYGLATQPLQFQEKPAKKFRVRYIDQTTGKTVEKTIPDIEQYELYRLQREGKISIIEIHVAE